VLTDPEQLRPAERAESVTEDVAARFATVTQLLERRGFPPSRIAPFFMKLLFAFFAEDMRLLPGNLITQHLEASIFNPQEFPERMLALNLERAAAQGGAVRSIGNDAEEGAGEE